MLRLIRFLITGSWHEHTYEVIKEYDVNHRGGYLYRVYVSRCTKCGKITSKSV
jgi:uncharacterized Zn finger protein